MEHLRNHIRELFPQSPISVAVGGDVMFGRYVGYEYHPLEVKNPFNRVQEFFRDADLSIVNLETPLFDGTPTWWGKYDLPSENYQKVLVAPTNKVNELINVGINFVSLANNHADDAGPAGIASTQMVLDEADILHAGTSLGKDPFEPHTLIIGDKKIIVFSVTMERNFGKDWGDAKDQPMTVAHIDSLEVYERFLSMIDFQRTLDPSAFIFVSIHWGAQYKEEVETWQEIIAKDIVDAGANCILGHHPHVLQKVSSYGDALIFFSLGNLLFDHNYDIPGHASKKNARTMNGAIYTFEIEGDNTISTLNKIETTSTPSGILI